jgi:hypothetical protein
MILLYLAWELLKSFSDGKRLEQLHSTCIKRSRTDKKLASGTAK